MGGSATGAVLAGGASSRMGVPKAGLEVGGVPLVTRALRALAAGGLDVAVVAKAGDPLPALDVPVWRESRPERHPIAGILEALERAGSDGVVVCACDMPFVTPAFVARLAAQSGSAVPQAGGRLHPLLARYDASAVGVLAAALEASAPLQEAVRQLDPVLLAGEELAQFGDPARLLFNVNTRADLARAERMLSSAG